MKPAAILEPNLDSKYAGILMPVIARLLTLFILLFAGISAHAIDPDDLLEPDKAFRFSARAIDAATIEVTYRVAKGY